MSHRRFNLVSICTYVVQCKCKRIYIYAFAPCTSLHRGHKLHLFAPEFAPEFAPPYYFEMSRICKISKRLNLNNVGIGGQILKGFLMNIGCLGTRVCCQNSVYPIYNM